MNPLRCDKQSLQLLIVSRVEFRRLVFFSIQFAARKKHLHHHNPQRPPFSWRDGMVWWDREIHQPAGLCDSGVYYIIAVNSRRFVCINTEDVNIGDRTYSCPFSICRVFRKYDIAIQREKERCTSAQLSPAELCRWQRLPNSSRRG